LSSRTAEINGPLGDVIPQNQWDSQFRRSSPANTGGMTPMVE
jgi:hypothetical protein